MNSIHGLMAGIVDYAGLYPPASLEMAPTVHKYAKFREMPEREMLGRIVIPVSRFAEFEDAAAELLTPVPAAEGEEVEPDPWPITALISPASDHEALEADIEAIHAFNDAHTAEGHGAAIVDTLELQASSGAEIDAVLEDLDDELFPYFELDPTSDIRGALAALVGLDAGAKIRTGGVTVEAHPSPEVVAEFIAACQSAQVPFKATAGLHHPVRHFSESVGTKQLGFLNVFLGACLIHAKQIDADELLDVIKEEDPAAFAFGIDSAKWRDREISLEELEMARWRFAHSFGSCSFDEPLDDLRALGLLEKEASA